MSFVCRYLVAKILILPVAYFSLLLGACTYEGPHQPVKNSSISEEDTKQGLRGSGNGGSQKVVFAQVKPVFQKFCIRCHSSAPPKIAWLNYKAAARLAKSGKLHARVVKERSMPKKGSPESKAISQKDRDLIAQWIADGALKDQPIVNSNTPAEGKEASSSTAAVPLDPEQKAKMALADEWDLDEMKEWALFKKCTSCHGEMGMTSGEIPSLAGLSKDYIESQLLAFKSDQRKDPNESMNNYSKELSEEQISFIANFFSRLKFVASDVELDDLGKLEKKDRVKISNKIAKGKALVEEGACLSCHGNSFFPKITGQNNGYLINQITSFQSGKRKNETMNSILENFPLDEESIENLALYLSRQVNTFQDKEEDE